MKFFFFLFNFYSAFPSICSSFKKKKIKSYLLTETFPLKRVAGVPVAVQEVHTAEDLPHEILDLGGGQPWRWTLLQVTVEIL